MDITLDSVNRSFVHNLYKLECRMHVQFKRGNTSGNRAPFQKHFLVHNIDHWIHKTDRLIQRRFLDFEGRIARDETQSSFITLAIEAQKTENGERRRRRRRTKKGATRLATMAAARATNSACASSLANLPLEVSNLLPKTLLHTF